MNEILKISTVEGVKAANNLLSRIFGPTADELGLILSQPLRERAVMNQLRGLQKLQEKCEKEGFTMRQVNLKVLYPYLEGIAVEEDPELEKLWVNLMANYLDTNKNLQTTVYPSILKQISSPEAKALGVFYEGSVVNVGENETFSLSFNNQGFEKNMIEAPINNLHRLGLIERANTQTSGSGSGLLSNISSWFNIYKISPFGKDFYEACQRSEK